MRTYEYRCECCKNKFELRRDWNSAADIVQCPSCASADVRRIYSSIMMMSRSVDGTAQTIGGSSCGGCTTTSCGGCGQLK